MDANEARRLLEDERRRLLGVKDTGPEEAGFGLDPQQGATGELSSYGDHPGDHGTEMAERERAVSVRENVEIQLREVDEAVARLERGEYGRCEVCGRPIDDERLRARPATRFCLEHQEEAEGR